jgi:flagellar protein FliS
MNYRPRAAYQQYRDTQVMSADPLQLVIMVYDLAIAGCNERNLEKVTRGLAQLRDSLNHEDGGQLAADLLSIYIYLADQARKGNYEHVAQMLKELRDTWAIARKQILQQSSSVEAYSVAA